tara:strand:+ start:588 stop:1334 length:747 start_codon:yes stop_codon:yes gene_type:complete
MSAFEGLGYGLLNDALGFLRSDEGYALPSRYEIEIGQPKSIDMGTPSGGGGGLLGMFTKYVPSGLAGIVGGSKGGGLRNIQLRAESVQLPGRNLSTADDANVYGPVRTIADGVNFAEDINIVFQCGSELGERKFFEKWQESCYDMASWNMKYYWDYVGSIGIYLLDVNNKRRYGIQCAEAYPKTVGGIDLSYTPTTDIAKVTVSFVFRYWKQLDIEEKGYDMLGNMAETVLDNAERNLMRNIPSSLGL